MREYKIEARASVPYAMYIKANSNEEARKIMRIDYICKSLGGVPMYGMTITNNL